MSSKEQIKKWKEEDGPVLTIDEILKSVKLQESRENSARYHSGKGHYGKEYSYSWRFGISVEKVRRIRATECEVCGNQGLSEIDHNHVCLGCGIYTPRLIRGKALCGKCGKWLKVRGSLCRHHNTQMGFLESIVREGSYEKMVEYLRRYP